MCNVHNRVNIIYLLENSTEKDAKTIFWGNLLAVAPISSVSARFCALLQNLVSPVDIMALT